MTRPPLTRPSWWDSDLARDILRERAVTSTGTLGGRTVRLSCEPLLRHDGDGGLLQSVRIGLTGGDGAAATGTRPLTGPLTGPLTRVRITTGGGSPVRCEVLPGPGGDTRVLIPEVGSPTTLLAELPELEEGARLEFLAQPQRHWTLHLVQHAHLDIGYTDPQGTVMAEGRSYLDSLLELCRATDDWPEPARFRWSVEGFHSFEDWSANRPRRQVEEFLDRVREGRVELTAMPFNLHTETCSTDELHELLRPARELRRAHGIDIPSAMQTDVPGQVVGLPDVLAAGGVRYLSVAHNWAGRAVPHLVGGERLPRLFRWRAPSGSEVLVWRTDTPHGLAYMEGSVLGFDESYERVDDLLPAYLSAMAAHPYPHEGRGIPGFPILGPGPDAGADAEPYPWDVLHLRVLGKFADNGPPRLIIPQTVRRWNEEWAFPQLRTSRHQDFFEDAERRLGDRLETFEGDWSDWWVDGVGAGAVPLAATRQGQASLADAQTVAGYAQTLGATDSAAVTGAAPEVYRAASLFNEHTWGAGDPWTHGEHGHGSGERQWHWKYAQALRAHDDAGTLLDRAAALLGERLAAREGTLAGFHVVNTCSWERSETVRLFLPESTVALETAVRVLDARTGAPLPHIEEEQTNERHRTAGRFLLFTLTDVPASGSVRVDIVRGDGDGDGGPGGAAAPGAAAGSATAGDAGQAGPGPDRPAEPTVLENAHLRVRVDLGRACVSSVVDKRTGRELVRQDAALGLNGYLYDEYATAGGFNHQSSKTVADDSMHLLASRSAAPPAALVERRSDTTGETLVYACTPPGTTGLRVTVHLPRDAARIDLANRLGKDATLTKESAFFAFPFAMDAPVLRMEATGGVTGTGLPVVPGSAAHMRAVRRWVSLEEGGTGGAVAALATPDVPLVQTGNIRIPYAPYPYSLPQHEPGTVYSWVHNNIWDTNFPSQQAFEHTFRYSVGFGTAEGTGTGTGTAEDTATATATAESTATATGPEAVGAGPVLGMRTAAVHSHPLVPVRARGALQADPPATASFLSVGDPRVRVTGVTVPRTGALLVRLQSFAEEPVDCRVTPGFPVARAHEADYLGEPGRELAPDPGDGAVLLALPRLGTGAVLLEQTGQ